MPFIRRHSFPEIVGSVEDGADDETARYQERINTLQHRVNDDRQQLELELVGYRRWQRCRADISSLIFASGAQTKPAA